MDPQQLAVVKGGDSGQLSKGNCCTLNTRSHVLFMLLCVQILDVATGTVTRTLPGVRPTAQLDSSAGMQQSHCTGTAHPS